MAGKITCVNIETTQASAIPGGAITGPDKTWKTAGVHGCKYRKFPDGTVEVRTVVGTNPSGKLPVGFRSGSSTLLFISQTKTAGHEGLISFVSNGDIIANSDYSNVNIHSFRFFADGTNTTP